MKPLPAETLRHLRRLAWRVRKWSEEYDKENEVSWSGNLCGMCAISSVRLWHLLRKHGYRASIVMAWGHVFLVYRGYLLDVTATQFHSNIKKVVVRPWENQRERNGFWRARVRYWRPDLVYQRQLDEGWPEEQQILPEDATV